MGVHRRVCAKQNDMRDTAALLSNAIFSLLISNISEQFETESNEITRRVKLETILERVPRQIPGGIK